MSLLAVKEPAVPRRPALGTARATRTPGKVFGVPGAVLAAIALCLGLQISPYWYPTPDGASYLSIARSLASGRPPQNLGSRQLYYAPGYAVFVSPAFWTGDRVFLAISLLHWLAAVTYMLGVYAWARRRFSATPRHNLSRGALPRAPSPDPCRIQPLLLTAFVLVNVEFWSLFRRTLSETLFMGLLIHAVNALEGIVRAPSGRHRKRDLVTATLLVAALVSVRQAGITVAAGFTVLLMADTCRRRLRWRRAAGFACAVLGPAAGIFLALVLYDRAMVAAAGTPTYLDRLVDPSLSPAAQLSEGLRLRASECGRLLVPGMFKSYGRRGEWLNPNMAIHLPVAAFVLGGWWRWVKKRPDTAALSFPFYVGLYVLWPFDQAARFMVPMLPVLALCVAHALEGRVQRWRPLVAGAVGAHLVAAAGYWLVVDRPRALANHEQWPLVRQICTDVASDQGPVRALDVPLDLRMMIAFALDRHVEEQPPREPIPADVRWLLQPRRDGPVAGFQRHEEIGAYCLYRRRDAARPPGRPDHDPPGVMQAPP